MEIWEETSGIFRELSDAISGDGIWENIGKTFREIGSFVQRIGLFPSKELMAVQILHDSYCYIELELTY